MKLSFSPCALIALVAAAMASPAQATFEWAGAFPLADAQHTWSMQAVGGDYADPSMRLVLVSAADRTQAAIEASEAAATTLISSETDCQVLQEGETMGPIGADLMCYELTVGAGPDSFYPINTEGISGMVVYAQHFPTEFERDQHYLKVSNCLHTLRTTV